jgi:hypothetical protein
MNRQMSKQFKVSPELFERILHSPKSKWDVWYMLETDFPHVDIERVRFVRAASDVPPWGITGGFVEQTKRYLIVPWIRDDSDMLEQSLEVMVYVYLNAKPYGLRVSELLDLDDVYSETFRGIIHNGDEIHHARDALIALRSWPLSFILFRQIFSVTIYISNLFKFVPEDGAAFFDEAWRQIQQRNFIEYMSVTRITNTFLSWGPAAHVFISENRRIIADEIEKHTKIFVDEIFKEYKRVGGIAVLLVLMEEELRPYWDTIIEQLCVNAQRNAPTTSRLVRVVLDHEYARTIAIELDREWRPIYRPYETRLPLMDHGDYVGFSGYKGLLEYGNQFGTDMLPYRISSACMDTKFQTNLLSDAYVAYVIQYVMKNPDHFRMIYFRRRESGELASFMIYWIGKTPQDVAIGYVEAVCVDPRHRGQQLLGHMFGVVQMETLALARAASLREAYLALEPASESLKGVYAKYGFVTEMRKDGNAKFQYQGRDFGYYQTTMVAGQSGDPQRDLPCNYTLVDKSWKSLNVDEQAYLEEEEEGSKLYMQSRDNLITGFRHLRTPDFTYNK